MGREANVFKLVSEINSGLGSCKVYWQAEVEREAALFR